MTWQEASGTYWMAVLIMAILGYIKQKALLYHDADPRLRTYSRNPTLPCDYLGAFSLGEFWGYLIQDFGIPLPVFANKILGRADRVDRRHRKCADRHLGIADSPYAAAGGGDFCRPLVLRDGCV